MELKEAGEHRDEADDAELANVRLLLPAMGQATPDETPADGALEAKEDDEVEVWPVDAAAKQSVEDNILAAQGSSGNLPLNHSIVKDVVSLATYLDAPFNGTFIHSVLILDWVRVARPPRMTARSRLPTMRKVIQ